VARNNCSGGTIIQILSPTLRRPLAWFVLSGLALASHRCANESRGRTSRQPPPARTRTAVRCVPEVVDTNPDAVGTDWQKKEWIDKAATRLLAGAEVDASTRAAWAARPRADVVRDLVSDPRFADTVLDFNLYFLGFKRDSVKDASGALAAGVFDFPQAISSAKNVLDCGDYLTLFDLRQPIFPADASKLKPIHQSFDASRAEFLKALDGYLGQVDGHPSADLPKLCSDFTESGSRLGYLLFTMGLPANLSFSTTQWLVDIRRSCSEPQSSLESFSSALHKVRDSFEDLLSALAKVDPASSHDLAHVTPLATHAFGSDGKTIQFISRVPQSLTNSSTNYNRKRAAYVLDRFFGDDLTPINVENAAVHAGGRHASDPPCYACHYRLDPMAGFFKDHGIAFDDYRGASSITFDDMAVMPKAQYDQAWRAPAGSGREWTIGYIRSANDDTRNTYGNDLEDLFRIIKTAPEVKRCLVRRMHEYLIGPDQAIDGKYLDSLTQRFTSTAARNSTVAVKELVASLILSRAFVESDREPGACYDSTPGNAQPDAPPCRASHLLAKNCSSCHGSSNPDGGLDLSRWVRGPDARMTFPHTVRHQQVPRNATLRRMADRLNDPDPRRRMPRDRYMSPLERQELFKWVRQTLDGSSE
jgi:hypothetical protein